MTSPSAPITPDRLAHCIARLADAFEGAGLWYTLAYGTLLGALRGGDIIAWDFDFDFLVRPEEAARILALNPLVAPHGLELKQRTLPGKRLAINNTGKATFDPRSISVFHEGEKAGDLYLFAPFTDGVLRLYDLAGETYWCPHSSFPAWFVEERSEVTLRGRSYPAPRDAEKLIAGIYGDDWRTPYRAVLQGGVARAGTTTHGDRYEPKLRAEIEWCVSRGWDRSRYAQCPIWPRAVAGAGPRGPTARTFKNSQSLWWRDFRELIETF